MESDRFPILVLWGLLAGWSPRVASGAPPVLGRDTWGARPARPGASPQQPRRITLHHTGVAAPGSAAEVARQLRSIQRYHQDEKGWPDIAYHVLIDPFGGVHQGRDLGHQGDSATRYDLSDRALVCLLGDFQQAGPAELQWKALLAVVAGLRDRYRIAPDEVTVHRDLAATTCPGDHFMDRWRAWRSSNGVGSSGARRRDTQIRTRTPVSGRQ